MITPTKALMDADVAVLTIVVSVLVKYSTTCTSIKRSLLPVSCGQVFVESGRHS